MEKPIIHFNAVTLNRT